MKLFRYKTSKIAKRENMCNIASPFTISLSSCVSRNIKRKLEAGLKVHEMYSYFHRTGHMHCMPKVFLMDSFFSPSLDCIFTLILTRAKTDPVFNNNGLFLAFDACV